MLNYFKFNKLVCLKKNNFIYFYFFTEYQKFLLQSLFRYNSCCIFTKQVYSSFRFFFKKLFFVGKTYRLRKKKNHIKFYFNRSNKTFVFFKHFSYVNRLKKNKLRFMFFFGNDFSVFLKYSMMIRSLNFFTKRGIRISKTPKYSKKGKISAYR